MKTLNHFFIVLCFAFIGTTKISAQTELELDFPSKEFKKPDALNTLVEGNFYRLKVSGLNTNLYNVIIGRNDSILKSDVEIPMFDILNLENLLKLITDLKPLSTTAPAGNLETFTKSKINQPIPAADPFAKRINKEMLYLIEKTDDIKNINRSIEDVNFKIQRLILSYYVVDSPSAIFSALNNSNGTSYNLPAAIRNIEEILQTIKSLIQDVTAKRNLYFLFEMTPPGIPKKYQAANVEIKTVYSKILEGSDSLLKNMSGEKVDSILIHLINLSNNPRTFTSLPFQLLGDLSTMEIRIEPKKAEFGLPSYSTQIRFPKKTLQYIGVGMSFYWASLTNEAYSTAASGPDSATSYTIKKETQSIGEVGIATMLHFGKKSSTGLWGYHLSIGPAFSLSNTIKPRLASGIGISLGKKQMLCLDALLIAGMIDKKSVAFDENSSYSKKPEQITVSRLGWGGAISLGYIYKF